MLRIARQALALTTACFAVLATPAIALQWGSLTDISPSDKSNATPRVATGADGTTTIVWERWNSPSYTVQAATRTAGGTLGSPVSLATGSGTNHLTPAVAVGPDGTTTVAWVAATGPNMIVRVSTRSGTGAFSAPVDISAASPVVWGPRLVTGDDGTTTVVWSQSDDGGASVNASTRPAGGTFGAPVTLSTPTLADSTGEDPQIAAGADGTTAIVWKRSNGTNSIVQVSRRAPGGVFSAPIDLSATGSDAQQPRVAVTTTGTVAAIWIGKGGNYIIQASAAAPGGSFDAPSDLSAPGQLSEWPRIAAGPDGSVTTLWNRRSAFTGGELQSSFRPANGSFQVATSLMPPGKSGEEPQLAIAADGTTTVAWYARVKPTEALVVRALTRPPGGSFGEAETLSPVTLSNVMDPQLAAGGGVTASVWRRYSDASHTDVIQGRFMSDVKPPPSPLPPPPSPSPPVTPPSPPKPPPVRVAKPAARSSAKLRGQARLGRRLTCKAARFSHATKLTTSWLRNGKPIKGAKKSTYKVTKKDLGKKLACRTTATGPGGTAKKTSTALKARR